MITAIVRRPRLTIFVTLAVLASVLASPAAAATLPVDVSGPVDGAGPGVAVDPASNVVTGTTPVTVSAENLPTQTEAEAWVDDGDFSDETGTYGGSVTVALCGNADSTGTALGTAFDPLLHCDGGDARSSTFLVTTTATSGAISVSPPTRDGQGFFDYDDDGDPNTTPIPASDGIGSAEATCVPGAGPCRFHVTDGTDVTDTTNVFFGLAAFEVVPNPTLTLVSVTGQLAGAEAARGGDELAVSGTDWDPASALAAALCDAADPTVCDASSSTAGLTIDASGVLSGSVPVSTLNTTGSRVLKLTQSSNGATALMPIVILGARAITIDPTSGGAGTAVNITGNGFDPLQAVTVTGSDGVNPTSDVGSAVVDSVGGLTGSILIESPATVSIVVTEDDAPSTEGASAPFSFTVQEQIGQVVIDGAALTLSQAAGEVTMTSVTLSGLNQQSTGALQTITVDDARGTLAGWSVTATATDWVDVVEPDPTAPAPNHWIPAGNLTWLPSCAPAPGSTADPAEVTAGPAASLDPTLAATLCVAAAGGGGGSWVGDAILVLDVPSSIASGTYQATLTIVAT